MYDAILTPIKQTGANFFSKANNAAKTVFTQGYNPLATETLTETSGGRMGQAGYINRDFHNITVRSRPLNNMQTGEILSVVSFGQRLTGSAGSYASLVLCNTGTYAQAYTGVAPNTAETYVNSWPTPYIMNIVGNLPPNNKEGTGALPIVDNTYPTNNKIGLKYATYSIEFSNNKTSNCHIELWVCLCKSNTSQTVVDCITNTDQDFGLGAAAAIGPAAGSLTTSRVYGYPSHTTLGTKMSDFPAVKKNWQVLKKISFILPAASNHEHTFSIKYNTIFDQSTDVSNGTTLNYLAGKTLQFYYRAKGEVVVDATSATKLVTTDSTDVSCVIVARKHFAAPNDPIQPTLKFASIALPQAAVNSAIKVVTSGESGGAVTSLFD